MGKIMKAPKIPDHLYSVCSYFLPRLMFLRSNYAAQINWGDISIALDNFPPDCVDLSSVEFWENWMQRWAQLGMDHCTKANNAKSEFGKKQLFRSAAACYHWAEFMYFSDAFIKSQLRKKVKECFELSLDKTKLNIHFGTTTWNTIGIPYYLILPDKKAHSVNSLPCVILSNGLDSVTEVEIFAFAEQFLSYGIATLLFDGPGQGINLGRNPLELRFELVIQHLIREVLQKESSINMNRLSFFGVSFGGYFALRVAEFIGDLFKCVVNLSGGPYLTPFDCMKRRLKEDFKYAFMVNDNKSMQNIFDIISLSLTKKFNTDVLSIHGALDDIFPVEGLKEMDTISGKNHELRVYESEAHVCLNYINQYSTEIAEWVSSKI